MPLPRHNSDYDRRLQQDDRRHANLQRTGRADDRAAAQLAEIGAGDGPCRRVPGRGSAPPSSGPASWCRLDARGGPDGRLGRQRQPVRAAGRPSRRGRGVVGVASGHGAQRRQLRRRAGRACSLEAVLAAPSPPPATQPWSPSATRRAGGSARLLRQPLRLCGRVRGRAGGDGRRWRLGARGAGRARRSGAAGRPSPCPRVRRGARRAGPCAGAARPRPRGGRLDRRAWPASRPSSRAAPATPAPTPMAGRRDALTGGRRARAGAARRRADASPAPSSRSATCCIADPASNVIPGRVSLSIDARAPSRRAAGGAAPSRRATARAAAAAPAARSVANRPGRPARCGSASASAQRSGDRGGGRRDRDRRSAVGRRPRRRRAGRGGRRLRACCSCAAETAASATAPTSSPTRPTWPLRSSVLPRHAGDAGRRLIASFHNRHDAHPPPHVRPAAAAPRARSADAARRVIARKGLEATTLRDIAREGGFTTGVVTPLLPRQAGGDRGRLRGRLRASGWPQREPRSEAARRRRSALEALVAGGDPR